MKSLFPIFKNKWIKALVLTILLQQLLVAGGTYFLGEITRLFPIEGFQISTALYLYESVLEPMPIDLSHLIQEDGISIKINDTVYSSGEIENLLDKHKAGRFTITGKNGVGKSSLLLKLKNKFRFSAAYLPAQHQLMLQEAKS